MVMQSTSAPNALPPSPTVPAGAGTPYAKKYVRVPVSVLRRQIMPAAADAASQALIINAVPAPARRRTYHAYLSQLIKRGIALYLQSEGDTQVTAQGILAAVGGAQALPSGV